MTTEEWQIGTGDSGPSPGNGSLSVSAFKANLVNAFKLAAFRTVPEDRIPVTWWQVAAFGLISWFIVYEIQSIRTSGEIAWDTVPSALVHLPIILFASIALAYLLGKGEQTLLLLQTFLMIAAAIDVAVYVIYLTAFTPHTPAVVQDSQLRRLSCAYGMACRGLREGGCGSAVGFDPASSVGLRALRNTDCRALHAHLS